jgi:4-alpha-glucanotransferase
MDPKQSGAGNGSGPDVTYPRVGTQPSDQLDQQLHQAATVFGIETEYWDVFGTKHEASRDLLVAILSSLGVDTATSDSLRNALEKRSWMQWCKPLPSTLVVTGTSKRDACISLPESRARSAAVLEIKFEQGGGVRIPIALDQFPVSDTAAFQGRRFVRKRIPLPADLPLGYHELSIHVAGEVSPSSRLIVCPQRAYQPEWLQSGRGAGIAISLYGVRSERNWGCGDATDLKNVADWVAAEANASFIGLNPLHAIPNRQPYNTSPYLPNSIFYRNPLYLDIEAIEDFRNTPRAQSLVASAGVQEEVGALRAAEFVEYERAYRLKMCFLKLLFRTFLREWRRNTARAADLRAYLEREGDLLHRFAVHAALDEAIHKRNPDAWNWQAWPVSHQDPYSQQTREFAEQHWRSVLFHKYVQWQLDLQLAEAQRHACERGLRVGLYHDLALATDRFGADLWAHREFFVDGCRVGAPPDIFSPKGQDWSFPPPNSQRHYEDGYRLFAESIRRNCRHGGALRIDHVMRFCRLYWIPEGMDATQGTYVRDRYEDLLAVLALESVRQKVFVIGEDLGTVPDEIRAALQRFGIFSYKLLYFEQDANGRFHLPAEYPMEALASVTTHDLPTLAGFWLGRDIDARRNAGLLPDEASYRKMMETRAQEKQHLLDLLTHLNMLPAWFPRNAADIPELTGELHNAIVGFLASTPSKLMLLNQEDLLKETNQQNLPGSTAEYPNWRHKMKCTTEELWTSLEVRAFVAMFRSWLERTGRVNAVAAEEPAAHIK